MDYSFERAFTIQEKEYMLAYKVSWPFSIIWPVIKYE